MDENLNWKSETSHVANKVSKCIGIFLKNPLSIYLQNFYEHYIFLQFIHVFLLQFSLGLCLQNYPYSS